MKAQGVVDLAHEERLQLTGRRSQPLDRDRADFTTPQDNPFEAVASHLSRSPDRSQSSQAAA
jgi:hypothetical protein